MAGSASALEAHLASGTTTLCRCWVVRRRDGQVMGFTDHDSDLEFDGVLFRAETGMSARAISQTTGLSVDNSEAMGALSSASITEADLAAGRYDGASVEAWLVNWRNPQERALRFRGTLGEIRSGAGAYHAELRGLTDLLNRPFGRLYQPRCRADLGDAACGVDLAAPEFRVGATVARALDGVVFQVGGAGGYDDGWFERGQMRVTGGAALNLTATIKVDRRLENGAREITLWQELRVDLGAGDTVELFAGCDKRMSTCRDRFANLMNFRGFPHIPGEDWLMAVPTRGDRNDGGSRVS